MAELNNFLMERLLCFHKGILSSHVNEFSFQKLSLCSERKAFLCKKKDSYTDIKSDDKKSMLLFLH